MIGTGRTSDSGAPQSRDIFKNGRDAESETSALPADTDPRYERGGNWIIVNLGMPRHAMLISRGATPRSPSLLLLHVVALATRTDRLVLPKIHEHESLLQREV